MPSRSIFANCGPAISRDRPELPAQGGTAAAGQRRHRTGAGRQHSVQRNSGPVVLMAGPSEQDKLSEDWGLDETLPLTGTTPLAPEKGDDAMSAEWTAMLEGDGKLAPPGGADRVL